MLFMSRTRDQRIILKPSDVTYDDKKRPIINRGITVEFIGGKFQTDKEDVIALLLQHPLYGAKFTSVDNEQAWLAAHPNLQSQSVNSGAISSTNLGARQDIISKPEVLKEEEPVVEIGPSLVDIIDERIEKALLPFADKILKAINETMELAPPKKIFACPYGCGATFVSGFDVGKHKKDCKMKPVEAVAAT